MSIRAKYQVFVQRINIISRVNEALKMNHRSSAIVTDILPIQGWRWLPPPPKVCTVHRGHTSPIFRLIYTATCLVSSASLISQSGSFVLPAVM